MPPPDRPLSPAHFITHLSLIGFATALSTRAVDPIIPPIADSLATDPARVALLTTAFTLPFVVAQPFLGPAADAIGKLRMMLFCIAIVIAMSLACALAPNFQMLLIARMVCGAATGGIYPVGMAIIADAVPVAERQVANARWLSPTCAESGGGSRQIKALAEKSSLHFRFEWRRSGAGCEGRQPLFGEAHALGQDDAEAVEKGGLGGVRLGDAAQPDLSVGGGR